MTEVFVQNNPFPLFSGDGEWVWDGGEGGNQDLSRCRGEGGSGGGVSARVDFSNADTEGMSRCRGARGRSGAGITRANSGSTEDESPTTVEFTPISVPDLLLRGVDGDTDGKDECTGGYE